MTIDCRLLEKNAEIAGYTFVDRNQNIVPLHCQNE